MSRSFCEVFSGAGLSGMVGAEGSRRLEFSMIFSAVPDFLSQISIANELVINSLMKGPKDI